MKGYVTIGPDYTWFDNINILFNATGEYDVIFEVDDMDTGMHWESHCWYYVYATNATLNLGLYQPNVVMNYQWVWIDFTVDNLYDSPHDLQVNLTLTHPDGSLEVLFDENIFLPNLERFMGHVEYYFTSAGYYTVTFTVYDYITGQVYTMYCWFDVQEMEWDISLDATYPQNRTIGDSMDLQVEIWNNGDIDFDGDLKIILRSNSTVFYEAAVHVAPHQQITINLNNIFHQTGTYNFAILLVDKAGTHEWNTTAIYYVEEPPTSTTTTTPTDTNTETTNTTIISTNTTILTETNATSSGTSGVTAPPPAVIPGYGLLVGVFALILIPILRRRRS